MKVLAIETSCDETAIAFLEATGELGSPKIKILKNAVSSQVSVHRPFGGVVPSLAKREHLKNLPVVLSEVLGESPERHKVDVIAVTVGPGLEPALWTGITFAKDLHKKFRSAGLKTKLVGVNHLEGHLYSYTLARKNKKRIFPAVALLVSGGHTILLKMDSPTKMRKLGETRDDAVGEAFDKVARLLDLPYPGGPEVEKLAASGNPNAIAFPRPMIHSKNYDFSFSGLKTSVLYFLRGWNVHQTNEGELLADVAASFQEAAVDVLVAKTMRAVKEFKAKSVMLSGGVAANVHLRKTLDRESKKRRIPFIVAPFKFNTDNAVMIGVAAYMSVLRKKNRAIRAQANLNL